MCFLKSINRNIPIFKNIVLAMSCIIFFSFIITSHADDIKVHDEKREILSVIIQPFDDIPPDLLNYVSGELKKVCPNVEINTAISLPASAYYRPRGRHRADILIAYLAKMASDNQVIIGLTSKDISTTKGKIKDWGVMGLGYCPGKACIASSFRLDKSDRGKQLFKVAIHELGHTQGLSHCTDNSCLMRDAKGKNTTREENFFCKKCRASLKEVGFILD